LIDAKREYPIEVQSIIGINTQFIQPKALTWTVDNPEICNVQDGILTGLVNGETFVVGQLGEEKDTLKVIVEIPEGPSYVIDLNETTIASWEVKSSSNKKWETTLVPATAAYNAKITFTYSAMRQPHIQLLPNMRLYSLPKSMEVTINPNSAKFSSILFAFTPNNEVTTTVKEFANIVDNKEQTLTINFDSILANPKDIAIYPLVLNYIKFNISSEMENMAHVVDINSIKLIYEQMTVELGNVMNSTQLLVYPNPTSDYIIVDANIGDDICIYNLDGQCLYQSVVTNAQLTINISSLSSGTYIVKSGSASCKVIIK
jgi:hypothetical protein